MQWQYSGTRAESVDSDYRAFNDTPEPVRIGGEPYLVRSHYLVPYLPPDEEDREHERRRRGRLNIELCDRVFRLSDARDVAHRGEAGDVAIRELIGQYEAAGGNVPRGIALVLFGRIVSRIRDLSREYLESEAPDALERIIALYEYAMVERSDLFNHIRLYDGSIDRDGIIREAFSEIGKPPRQSLESIYGGRAAKIGEAMEAIHKVAYYMEEALYQQPTLPSGTVHEATERFARLAAQLAGIPSTEAEAFDRISAAYIDARDAAYREVAQVSMHNTGLSRHYRLVDWLQQGLSLIHSMQNIRDSRKESIKAFKTRLQE